MKIKLDKLDKLFSLFIRLRDEVCQRCGGSGRLQCSHFHGRAKKSVRWDEDNAVAFCFGCHMYFTANPYEHTIWFENHLGEVKFEFLGCRSRKMGMPDKEAIELYLKEKIKLLGGQMMEAKNNPYRKYYANFPEGVGINCSNCVGAYDEGHQVAIREVVEWIDGNRFGERIPLQPWQAQKKEWFNEKK